MKDSLSHHDLAEQEAAELCLVPFTRGAEGVRYGSRSEVMELVPVPAGLDAGLAVARAFGPGRLAVLGHLGHGAVQAAAGLSSDQDWLILSHGKAEIRLHRDGRLRIGGADVRLEAEGLLALNAAQIGLN